MNNIKTWKTVKSFPFDSKEYVLYPSSSEGACLSHLINFKGKSGLWEFMENFMGTYSSLLHFPSLLGLIDICGGPNICNLTLNPEDKIL